MGIKIKNVFLNILLYSVMILYFLILFVILFQKKSIGSFQSINLIPFCTIIEYLFPVNIISKSFALSNLLGNIVIFVPLGIYIMLINRNKSIVVNTIITAFISIFVEVVQFIFRLGVTDIDDVILNTIGGLVGIILFQVIHLIFKSNTKLVVSIIIPLGGVLAFFILILVNIKHWFKMVSLV